MLLALYYLSMKRRTHWASCTFISCFFTEHCGAARAETSVTDGKPKADRHPTALRTQRPWFCCLWGSLLWWALCDHGERTTGPRNWPSESSLCAFSFCPPVALIQLSCPRPVLSGAMAIMQRQQNVQAHRIFWNLQEELAARCHHTKPGAQKGLTLE